MVDNRVFIKISAICRLIRSNKKMLRSLAAAAVRVVPTSLTRAVYVRTTNPCMQCLRNTALGTERIGELHTTAVVAVLDKDVRGKKALIRSAQQSKQEQLEPNEELDFSLEGLTEVGITIPTLETHAMLIDGVRYDELPIVHIKASLNNTIITVTDHTGINGITRSSCGAEGFKNVKKSTNVAAQATGMSVGNKIIKKGLQHVRVKVKGLGAGRLASIKGLQMSGVKIVSLSDWTSYPFNGPRPRKAKRL